MKSRVKCRIEWAGIKYLLGRCVGEGGVEISFACGYIYWGSLFIFRCQRVEW